MVFKVKHNELIEVSNTILKDSNDYSSEVEKMLKDIEDLRRVWQGEDAEQFCNNLETYLTNMKNLPATMQKMSYAINAINKGYEDCDEFFENALKAEADNYEE